MEIDFLFHFSISQFVNFKYQSLTKWNNIKDINKIFIESRNRKESYRMYYSVFENIYTSQFKFYFLKMNNQYVLKVSKF
jgi:hypothetical protein